MNISKCGGILLLSAILLLLLAVALVYAGSLSGKIQTVEDCHDLSYIAEEKVYGDCTGNPVTICDDEPANQSCKEQPSHYTCLTEVKTVPKTMKSCSTTGLVVNQEVKLNTPNYECSGEDAGGDKIIVTCDSKFDGNGDGKCTSGESCMQFIIEGKTVTRLEKNSRDDFVEADESFFVERASAEVLE